MGLLDFWQIKFDHLFSKRLVSCILSFSKRLVLAKTLEELQKSPNMEVPMDSGLKTPKEFYIKIFKFKEHSKKIKSNHSFNPQNSTWIKFQASTKF